MPPKKQARCECDKCAEDGVKESGQTDATCTCHSPSPVTDSPIAFFDGEIQLSVTDIGSSGFGLPWGHTRNYVNQMAYDYDYGNGYNWQVSQQPYVQREGSSTLAVVRSPRTVLWFDLVSTTWTPRYGAKQTLVHDTTARVYRLTATNGHIWEFNDFSFGQTNPKGLFKSLSIAGGQKVEVTSYAGGDIGEVQRSFSSGGTTTIESYLYSYITSGGNAGRLEYVTLRRKVGAGAWTDIRRAKYSYYGASESYGTLGDLKTATYQVLVGTTWTDKDTHYYRYYTDTAGGTGFVHGLRYVLGPEAYRRLAADPDVTDPLTASNSKAAQYADHYFEYDGSRRVTKETTGGGAFAYTYSFTTSAHADAYNNWKRKTVETRPDGSQVICYTNYVGAVLIKELKSGSNRWIEYQKFNADGRPIQVARPSAVTGYDDTVANLDVALRASDGLIFVYDYYSTSGGGAAPGYVQHEKIKKGNSGTEVKLRSFEYTSRTSGTTTIYPVSKESVYRNDDGTGAIHTSFAYTWHGTTFQIEDRTTTLPAVPTNQNGSGTSATRIERFDDRGQLIWLKDERGYIFRRKYDTVSGALTQKIDDVDTTQVTDEPSGWVTPTGGGLHLITDLEYDDLGRVTQVLGPSHDVDGVTVRTADWTVYKEIEEEVWTARGYATGTAPNYTYTLVNPVSISKRDDAGRTTDQVVATRASTSGKLSSGDSFAQTTWVRWMKSTYNDKNQLTARRVYHTIPASGSGSSGTNYDETMFGYDAMGRQNMRKSPGGTIARTVFEIRGLPTKIYVGTNDTGATESDPTGGGASGNNMVLVTEHEYDGGGAGGDGNQTKLTQHVDGSTTRVTTYGFDFRRRQTSIDGEVDFYQENTHDNLDRVTRVDRKNTTSGGNLIGRSETKFDDRGRGYQRISFEVDPATGTVGNSLTDNTWFDAANHVIKQKSAGSEAFTKTVYDGLSRHAKRYVGYDTAETVYADASIVTGDTLFEQVEATYDAAGNVLYATTRRRFHDATGTGELTSPTGAQPKARVSYVARWYDGASRQKATADYGTNGGASFSRPTTVPTRSDTVLVSSVEFNDDSEAYKSLDPKATETRQEFDDAGRRTKLIENYVDGDPSTGTTDQDRTTQWTYTTDGQVKTLTAKNLTTGDQVTKYVYGTTLTDSDIARSDLLRAVIYPDSDDVDAPLSNGADGVYDRVEHKYNRQGEVKETKDQIETIHVYDFDKLGRRTQDRVTTLGSGVDGAVRRLGSTYEVRGIVEKVTSYDNATVGSGSVVNEVQHAYNSFGQPTTEYQEHGGAVNTGTSPKVQFAYANGSANHARRTSMTYPNGRVLNDNYGSSGSQADNLGRVAALVDNDGSSHLVDYTYLGVGAFVKVDYPEPDIRLDLAFGAGSDAYDGLDRFDRVVDHRWQSYSGTPTDVARIQHGYDRASNRLYREDPVAAANSFHQDELYAYDALYQLKNFKRGDLNVTKDGIVAGTLTFEQDWALDATGNWSTFKEDSDGNGSWNLDQPRTHNKVNELTVIGATTGPNWADPVYDNAGNMTTLPQPTAPTASYTGTWDAWSRLVKLMDGAATVGEYAYDGLTRRTKKMVSGITRHFYYSDQWQVLEERLGTSSNADRQFVWGLRYLDDLVLRDRDTSLPADGTLDERLYALQDPNWNVTVIANGSGAVQERFAYSAYGDTLVYTATFGSRSSSSFNWETRFAGYRWDVESGLYQVRYRPLHPLLGRWASRDPLEDRERLNAYEYAAGRPLQLGDPTGQTPYDLMAKLWGDCIPKAIGVTASGEIMGRLLPYLPGLVAGAGTVVIFFPDTCEVGVFTIYVGLANAVGQWRLPTRKDLEEGFGVIASIGAGVEGAVLVKRGPGGLPIPCTAGEASCASFAGIFHTLTVDWIGVPVAGSVYVGDPGKVAGGTIIWVGGTITGGAGGGAAYTPWNYVVQTCITLPACICYPLIAAL